MGDLQVGDEVLAADGSTTVVEAVFPQGVKPIYRITLSDGSTTRSTLDHLWQAREEGEDQFKVLPLSAVREAMSLGKRFEIVPLGKNGMFSFATKDWRLANALEETASRCGMGVR
jgi:hypothetical protein